MKKGLASANSTREKDELILGLFTVFNESDELRSQLRTYGSSAQGRVERSEHAEKGVSSFPTLPEFPLIYRQVCVRIYIGVVQQQLVESFFSKYDTCTLPSDSNEMDRVRTGQYKSPGSATISARGAKPRQIRDAGSAALQKARVVRKEVSATLPLERSQHKRPVDGRAVLKSLENLKKPRHAQVVERSSGTSSSRK